MTDQIDSTTTWDIACQQAGCPRCNWQFLLPAESSAVRCPNCLAADLEILGSTDSSGLPSPELYLPVQVSRAALDTSIQNFAGGLWFPPGDLTLTNLLARTRLVYLPVWLVDSQVQAGWQAEMGYNYAVVSHQDRYDDSVGGWRSRQVEETRLRWEQRTGNLDRSYDNVTAPALASHSAAVSKLGEYDYRRAQAYSPSGAFGEVKAWAAALPDRSAEDAWPEAIPVLQASAAEECREASGADQVRGFHWIPEFQQRRWTLLLLPVLSTYYLDDDRQPRPVLVNGQSGHLSGVRRASWERARTAAVWLGIACALSLVAALVLGAIGAVMPPLLAIAAVLLFAGLALGVGAVVPLAVVWSVNKK